MFSSLLGDTKSHKDLHTIKQCLLLHFATCENGVKARMKTQIKSTRVCNTQEHKVLRSLAQIDQMQRLCGLDCLGDVAMNVWLFVIALVFSMCWLGHL